MDLPSSPTVHAENEQDQPVDVDRWSALARAVLRDENVTANAELSLFFVDEVEMALLNEQYMGEACATDVLSFPIDGVTDLEHDSDVPRLLGDVVVCPAVAARNAPRHSGTHAPLHQGDLDDELALLVVHGVLHLLGYDHATPDEEATMQTRERTLLSAHHRRSVT